LAESFEATTGLRGERDPREILDLYAMMLELEARLHWPGEQPEELPPSLYLFLCKVFAELKSGKPVTILTDGVDLTTVEAARMLSVSRQFLVQLLEQNQIPFHMVGTHRRVYARDLTAFKAKQNSAWERKPSEFAWEAEAGESDGPPGQDAPIAKTVEWPAIKDDVRDDLLTGDSKEPLIRLNALDRLEKELEALYPEFPTKPAVLLNAGKDEVALRLVQMRAGGLLHAAESDVLNNIFKRLGRSTLVIE
jgi:excisionase family DNA binding protein